MTDRAQLVDGGVPVWARTASELAARIAAQELTSTEVVEAHLGRIAKVNPSINAFTTILAEDAVASAVRADEQVARGASLGPLHGVPITIKDNVDVRGSSTTQGVDDGPHTVAPMDAPVVERLRSAGAIVIAKTNMPDFGARVHTQSRLHGTTLNPWDASITTSGSSGGEAAAIATGMSPLGIGNDTGGSLRNPSSACGIACIKPSAGIIPHASSIEPRDLSIVEQLLTVNGVMARSVADLRLGLQVTAGPSPRDPSSLPIPLTTADGPKPAVAVLPEPPGGDTHPGIASAVRGAADMLADAGYEVEEATPPNYHEMSELWGAFVLAELRNGRADIDRWASPEAVRFLDLLDTVFPDTDLATFLAASARRNQFARSWAEFQAAYPLILSPVWTQPAFRVGFDLVGSEEVRNLTAALRPVLPANVLGLPAVVVPVGTLGHLPVGVQVMGHRFLDYSCLDAAEQIERRTGGLTPIDPRGPA